MKRRVGLILLLLVAGAIINVAVAWGLLLRAWPSPTSPVHGVARHVSDKEHTTIQRRRGEFRVSQAYLPRHPLAGPPRPVISEEEYARIVPAWSQFSTSEPIRSWLHELKAADLGIGITEHACGWPVLTSQYTFVERVAPRNARYVVHCNGLSLPAEWQDLNLMRRALPIRPLWPGFAINTVFYAGVLWLLFAAPFALRRRSRRRRGLCPKCAYPVGSSDTCTECGKPVQPRTPEAA